MWAYPLQDSMPPLSDPILLARYQSSQRSRQGAIFPDVDGHEVSVAQTSLHLQGGEIFDRCGIDRDVNV
jgi:hypothetical protein